MVEVSEGLLLGGEGDAEAVVSRQKSFVKRHTVTHILSITNEPPDWLSPDQSQHEDPIDGDGSDVASVDKKVEAPKRPNFTTMFLEAADLPQTDLLHHFPKCCQFIKQGVDMGAVLVHCVYGISRSATVVLAYLMWKEGRPLHTIFKEVLTKKPDIRPNEGFMKQLQLWGAMKCHIDVTNKHYKMYRLKHMAVNLDLQNVSCKEVVRDTMSVDPSLQALESTAYYLCRKCRRLLFTEESVLQHEEGVGQTSFKWHKRSVPSAMLVSSPPAMTSHDMETTPTTVSEQFNLHSSPVQVTSVVTNSNNKTCSSYFIEPVAWMEQLLLGNIEGKVLCPKCESRLGSFSWVGHQCSCGQWVNPSFQIHKGKVDETRSLFKRKMTQKPENM